MSAQGAQVIDLTEYRRRRGAEQARAASAPGPSVAPIVWVPVWMWVPFWPMR
jgi:hypothetical protein